MPGRLLVIEDDQAISRSLRRLLAHAEYFVETVGSAEEAATHLNRDDGYDLLLLDVALPGVDGHACCRSLRSQGWTRPIIMLTGRGSSGDKIAGLGAGADDYVTKPFDPEELLARIHAQLRRARDYASGEGPASQIRIDDRLVVDLDRRDALVAGERAHLTAREFALLDVLARHLGKPLKKLWLYQQVWGCVSEVGIKLLTVTVRRLRMKIEPEPEAPRYLLSVRGFGYRLVTPEATQVSVTAS